MPYFTTSEEWQRQSALLLQARPTTARVTTKYTIPNLESPKYKKRKISKKSAESTSDNAAAEGPKVPRATLTLKTYDPESGVCLKYKTDRAQEVGRLIGGLGRLGRHMAALPEKAEMEPQAEGTDPVEQAHGTSAPVAGKETAAASAEAKPQTGGSGGGGGKKKKKGKK